MLHAISKLFDLKTEKENPLKNKIEKKKPNKFTISFHLHEELRLYLLKSFVGCCIFKSDKDKKLLKLYEKGEKMVDKEFDVL